jgi:hypothetical protein
MFYEPYIPDKDARSSGNIPTASYGCCSLGITKSPILADRRMRHSCFKDAGSVIYLSRLGQMFIVSWRCKSNKGF